MPFPISWSRWVIKKCSVRNGGPKRLSTGCAGRRFGLRPVIASRRRSVSFDCEIPLLKAGAESRIDRNRHRVVCEAGDGFRREERHATNAGKNGREAERV